MTRMLIVGPQGSGKGTQAKLISESLGIVAISTGDIFRANIKGETELGKEAKGYVDAGDLVPDSLTNRLVEDRLGWDDAAAGFLLWAQVVGLGDRGALYRDGEAARMRGVDVPGAFGKRGPLDAGVESIDKIEILPAVRSVREA